jgi:hypothetical protein
VEVREGKTQVLELRRHDRDMLAELLRYADEVQKGVDAGKVTKPKAAKRTRARGGLGSMWKNMRAQRLHALKREAGGGS